MNINFIKSFISWIISQFIISVITWIVYLTLLTDLFKTEITLFQWIAIVFIISLIVPAGRPVKKENNKEYNKNKLSSLSNLVPNGRQRN